MKKRIQIFTLIITIICLFIGWDIYAQSSGVDSTGNYVLTVSSGQSIQSAISSLDMENDEIKNAESIIVELDGDFSNQTINVNLDKKITIKGKNSNRQSSLGWGQINISKNAKDVTLENLLFYGMSGDDPHEFITVDTPVALTMNNIKVEHASRPPDGVDYKHLIILKFTENASGTTANISNSSFSSIYEALSITGSNYNVTFDKVHLEGNPVMAIEKGESNHITFKNGSDVTAGSSWADSPDIEGISIKSQKDLQLEFIDSSVVNHYFNKENHLFSFDDANNQNCTINIKGNSTITDDNTKPNSKIFDFELDSPANNNKIIVGKDVTITPDDVVEKYATSGTSHAVGIHYDNGESIIKIYNDGSRIPEDELKLKNEDYTLKGWFKNKDLTEEFQGSESITADMDLYPKYTYPVTITIEGSEKKYTLQSDETYEILESKNSADFQTIKNPSNKTFEYFENEDGEKIENDYVFTKDTKLIPVYTVKVTFKEEQYTLHEGETLEDLDEPNKTKLKEATEESKKDFKNFVIKDTDTTVDNTYEFKENTELEAKYTVTITIGEEEFTLDEGSTLASLKGADLEKLNNIKNLYPNKHFKQFEIKMVGTKVVEDETSFSEHTELVVKYNVKITFKGKTEELLLDEGKTLADLKTDHEAELKDIIEVDDKTFAYYAFENKKLDDSYEFDVDTELELKYTVKVDVHTSIDSSITIPEVPEGTTLKDFLNDYQEQLAEVTNNKKKDLKSLLVDGKPIDENYTFNSNTEITPKYTVNVTFNDELTVTLDEGQSLEDLSPENSQKLEDLKKKIKENFDHFEKKDGTIVDSSSAINEHTDLYLKYNITIKIGSETLTLPMGKTISDLSREDEAKLTAITSPTDKTFVGFQIKNGETISNDQLSSYVFNNSLELIPIYDVTVKIDSLTFTLREGSTLKDLTKEQKSQVQELIEATEKTFKNYQIKGGDVIDEDHPFTANTELVINYQITITINDEKYTVEENETLNDIPASELNKFKNVDGKHFKHFKNADGTIIDEAHSFTKNETITPYYEVNITIGEVTLTLDEGQTLSELSEIEKGKLDSIKNVARKTFVHFETEDGKVIHEDTTKFNRDTTLIAVYGVKIIINGKEYPVKENGTLNDLDEEYKKAIQEIIKQSKKTLKNYQIKDGEVIDNNYKFTHDTELIINYQITITVKGKTFIVEDNAKLSSLSPEEQTRLDNLVKDKNKNFKFFKDSKGTLINDDYIFTFNTVLTPYYEIEIKIGDSTFILDEGKTLNDLSPDGKEALSKLQEDPTRTFNRFTNQFGNRIELNTKLNQNMTINAKFNIVITIDGEEFIIGEDECLNDLSDSDKERLKSLIKPGKDQEFAHYRNKETGEKVDLNTKFSKSTELETVYKAIAKDKLVDVPKTYDNIIIYVIGAFIGIIGLIGSILFVRKKLN